MVSEFQAYVGPRPFEEEDKTIFFGRDSEALDLRSLVIAHPLVLVYAQSGAGKTSLIKAGLTPLLKENKFEVFPVARVKGTLKGTLFENIKPDEISNIFIFNTVTSWVKDEYDVKRLAKMKLVEFLKEQKHMHDDHGMLVRRAVIFDQFEEIFFLYQNRWKEREGFFEQVSDAMDDDPLLRVVFVIREEFIAQLESYAYLLPERLRTHFHMERLRREDALLAIKEPVKKAGRSFADDAADELVDDLLKSRVETMPGEIEEVPGEFIEAVQLQVVCQSLWQELPSEERQITLQHLEKYGNVEKALYRFYDEAIRTAAETAGIDEESLRRLCGEVLITETGTRGMVFRAQESTGGVPNAAIDVLENMHLIRAEPRAGALWYELTHDRFIKPIQDSNKVFNDKLAEKQREEKERAERERAEKKLAEERERAEKKLAGEKERAEKKLAAERERAEKERLEIELAAEKERAESRRRIIKVLATASILCLILTGVAAFKWYQADQLKKILEASDIDAKSEMLHDNPKNIDESLLYAIEAFQNLNKISTDQATLSQIPTLSHILKRSTSEKSIYQADKSISGAFLLADKSIRRAFLLIPHKVVALNYDVPIVPITTKVSFSPDGKYIATASRDNTSRLWDAATGKQIFVLKHGNWVNNVVFSPNGKYIATASRDNTSRVWDAATGKQIFILGHNGPVNDVEFSPDGKYIATTSNDHTARIWDWNGTGKNVLKHNDAVNKIRFSPDRKYIATTADNKVSIWDAFKGKEPLTTLNVSGKVLDVTFSPDGKKVAVASGDNASIWDVFKGKEPLTTLNHDGGVNNVVFSPNGEKLATASKDRTACIWNLSTSERLRVLKHDYTLTRVSFSPNGKFIATSSEDETARLWDASTGKLVSVMNHNSGVNDVVFSPNGEKLATASNNETYIWDAYPEIPVLNHDNSVTTIAFSPDGKYVATASRDNTARLWNNSTGKQLAVMNHNGSLLDVTFSPKGEKLATASNDRTACIWNWNATDGRITLIHKLNHSGKVFNITFSPDGKYVATASADNTSRVWDASTGKQIFVFNHEGVVNRAVFGPDGKYVATASNDKTARIWDASTGEPVFVLNHAGMVNNVVFSPDGKYVATASNDNTSRIWDAATGENINSINHSNKVLDVVFSPNGSLVATASWDKSVSILNLNNATVGYIQIPLKSLTHDDYMFRVVFSPNGKYIATIDGRTALVWDVSTGEKIAAITHDEMVNDVIFSPDGNYIATASNDNTARLYRFNITDLITEASHCLTQNLKQEEWNNYM